MTNSAEKDLDAFANALDKAVERAYQEIQSTKQPLSPNEEYYQEKCTLPLFQFKTAFSKMIEDSVTMNREMGVRICQDKITDELSLGVICLGKECSISLPRGCYSGDLEDIGSFHTHGTEEPMLSAEDAILAIDHDEEFTCIGARYKGKEIMKCYVNDRSHPIFRRLHQRFQDARRDKSLKILFDKEEGDFVWTGWNEKLNWITFPQAGEGFRTKCEIETPIEQ